MVQDLGLLIRGIERPLAAGIDIDHASSISSTEDVPLHKLHALGLVKRLRLVHASSRHKVSPRLQTTNKAYEFPSNETCDADVLARADLNGWENTKRTIKRARKIHGESLLVLEHLEYLVLGPWDDERWKFYLLPFMVSTQPGRVQAVLPENEIDSLLAQYEPCLDILSSRHTCRTVKYGLYSVSPPNAGMKSAAIHGRGLAIVHAASFKDMRLYTPYAGPARLYIDVGLFKMCELDLSNKTERVEPFKSYDWALYPLDRSRLSKEQMAVGNIGVEFCLVSKHGDQAGFDLAVKVKDALEEFHEEVVKRKGKDRLWKGTVKVLIGDDIPVCPCCGTTA